MAPLSKWPLFERPQLLIHTLARSLPGCGKVRSPPAKFIADPFGIICRGADLIQSAVKHNGLAVPAAIQHFLEGEDEQQVAVAVAHFKTAAPGIAALFEKRPPHFFGAMESLEIGLLYAVELHTFGVGYAFVGLEEIKEKTRHWGTSFFEGF